MRYRDDFEDDFFEDDDDYRRENDKKEKKPKSYGQTHDHEYLESTLLAEEGDDRHNHRFAGVSSEVIPLPCGSHKHSFFVNTDFYDNHHHEVTGDTGPAIPIPGSKGKHTHFAKGRTTLDDGHFHEYQFLTLIEDPLHFNGAKER